MAAAHAAAPCGGSLRRRLVVAARTVILCCGGSREVGLRRRLDIMIDGCWWRCRLTAASHAAASHAVAPCGGNLWWRLVVAARAAIPCGGGSREVGLRRRLDIMENGRRWQRRPLMRRKLAVATRGGAARTATPRGGGPRGVGPRRRLHTMACDGCRWRRRPMAASAHGGSQR